MDALVTNNLKSEEPDDDVMVGDNAMSVKRGASFLMGYDPYEDTAKPTPKGSIGDAPMGEKPKENPLDGKLSFSSRKKSGADTSFGGDTTIAAASNLGPNPLGPNPFGLDFDDLDAKDKPAPAPAPVSAPARATSPAPVPIPGRASASASAPSSVAAPAAAPVTASKPVPAPASAAAPATVKVPDPEALKAMERKENSLSKYICVNEKSMIIFGSAFFDMEVDPDAITEEEEVPYIQASFDEKVQVPAAESKVEEMDPVSSVPADMDVKPLEEDKQEDAPALEEARLEPADDDSMGLTFGVTVSEEDDEMDLSSLNASSDDKSEGLMSDIEADDTAQESSSDNKTKTNTAGGVDPLMALLMAGGNPFGDNSKKPAPDLSFGEKALKPKHFEPMKASGPRVTAENVQANKPLGDNPFGVEVVPDFSMGKEALKPKKYVPKKSYETTEILPENQGEDDNTSDQP